MLDVKLGRFSPDLENTFIDIISSLKKRNKLFPIAIVSPSNKILSHLKKLITKHLSTTLNIHFHTFHTLAMEICRGANVNTHHLIQDRHFFNFVILHLIEQYFDDSLYLGKATRSDGMASALCATLRDLKDAAVTPDIALQALSEKFLGSEPIEKELEKTMEILKLYALYGEASNLYSVLDESDIIKLATTYAKDSPLLKQFGQIIYYGFYDLTGTQLDFFRAVSSEYNTTLFFPAVKGNTNYKFASDFFDTHIIGYTKDTQYVTTKAENMPSQLNTYVINTSGTWDEAWFVAKETLRLVESGYKFTDIGVAGRSIDTPLSIFEAVFRENLIPYSSSSREHISQYPITKTVYKLLSLIINNFRRRTVIDVINARFFKYDKKDLSTSWDILSKDLGIIKDADEWLKKLSPFRENGYTVNKDNKVSQVISGKEVSALYEVISALRDDIAQIPHTGSWAELSDKIGYLIKTHIKDDGDILPQILSIIKSYSTFDIVNSSTTLDKFLKQLLAQLEEARVENNHANINGVELLDAMSSRGLSFKILFIIDLNEKIFPRFILEDAFLRDRIRSRLSFTLGNKLSEKLKGYEEEQLLFQLLTDSASDKLYLLYQRSDSEGKVNIPSLYISDMLRNAITIPRRLSDKLQQLSPTFLTRKESSIYATLKQKNDDTHIKELGFDIDAFRISSSVNHHSQEAPGLTAYDGKVGKIQDYLSQVSGKGFSPTSLETFATCPFKYFSEKILQLSETIEPETINEPPPYILGREIHKIMEQFYRGLDKTDTQQIYEKLNTVYQNVFSEFEDAYPIAYPLLWEARKLKISKIIKDFIKSDVENIHNSNFIPKYFEMESSVKFKDIKLHGYIDRIDIKKNKNIVEFKVIDYKSGSSKGVKGKTTTNIKRGGLLQLPIYLLLAKAYIESNLGKKEPINVIPIEATCYYLSERDKDDNVVSKGINYDAFLEIEDCLYKLLQTISTYIHKGIFFIKPQDHGYCKYCNSSNICHKGYPPASKKARLSEEAKTFRNILHGDDTDE